jgi:signal peptidase I
LAVRIPASASKAIFYVLIIVFIVVAAQLVVGSAFGSSPVYVVVSSSMVPTLEKGDLVITQGVPFDSIQVGQVIIYQQPTGSGTCPNPSGETIVHRVVTVTPQGLITPECVNGKVILAVPYLGLISMIIPPPFNYILVILILIFVYLSESRPEGKDVSGEGNKAAYLTPLAKTRDGQTLSHKP